MTQVSHREATGLDFSAIHTHDTPEWMHKPGQLPAPWTLSPAFRTTWTNYMETLQRLAQVDAEGQQLNTHEAEREALAADEKAAAASPDPDDVPMVALEKLLHDRRRGAVKRGAAARSADAALAEAERLRYAEGFEALDPEAAAIVAKARARALKLVDELAPLLGKLSEWRAARVWTLGEPAIPDRDAQHLAEAIAAAVITQEEPHA